MKKLLKQVVKEKMDSISLEDQQLDKLLTLQSDNLLKTPETHWFFGYKYLPIMASTILLALILGVFLFINTPSLPTSSIIQKIANEVAGNHLKMKPMEIQTAAISEVQQYFTQLDFLPQQSQHIAAIEQRKLAGGRYCSIQGATAAQLRYKDKSGDYITLFETHYSPDIFKQLPDVDKGEQPVVTYARGIKVKIWVEHGLLMVSTEKPK